MLERTLGQKQSFCFIGYPPPGRPSLLEAKDCAVPDGGQRKAWNLGVGATGLFSLGVLPCIPASHDIPLQLLRPSRGCGLSEAFEESEKVRDRGP